MSREINYKNNPLHGVSLKTLLTEMVEHYGFKILFAYLNINCFKTNPSIESSIKFLKKTDWAREKVEAFYLYEFKNLPKVSSEQFKLPPRERIIPEEQSPGEPAELSLEDAERLREKREKKAAAYNQGRKYRSSKHVTTKQEKRAENQDNRSHKSASKNSSADPWAKWRDNSGN